LQDQHHTAGAAHIKVILPGSNCAGPKADLARVEFSAVEPAAADFGGSANRRYVLSL
jgi:hypothetical protein